MARPRLPCLSPPADPPRVRANPALLAAGWEYRYLASGQGARDARALYLDLGYEVLLEPPQPEQLDGTCAQCSAACHHGQLIYTRRPDHG